MIDGEVVTQSSDAVIAPARTSLHTLQDKQGTGGIEYKRNIL